jgi:hypothetical protein
VPAVDPVRLAQLVDVAVEQLHVGLHTERDGGRVHTGDAGPDHHDPGRLHAGHATHQHTAPAAGPHQVVGPRLRRQPARDLAHRRQQRK